MIVCYLDIMSISVQPSKADSPLVIDSDAMLSLSVARKFLKPISWGNPKVVQSLCRIQDS